MAEWCAACKAHGYTDGCKKCDDDYIGTVLGNIENELACALGCPARRVEYISNAMRILYEEFPNNFNIAKLDKRIHYMLDNPV